MNLGKLADAAEGGIAEVPVHFSEPVPVERVDVLRHQFLASLLSLSFAVGGVGGT
jgi:hypothetical protein